LVFLSLIRTFELRSKVLSLGKTKKVLVFLSLIRTFAAVFSIGREQMQMITIQLTSIIDAQKVETSGHGTGI